MLIPYEDGDIRLYQETLDYFIKHRSDQTILNLIYSKITGADGSFELFIPLIVFITSRFTENIAYSYMLSGILFYLIWIKLIKELVREYNIFSKTDSKFILALLISFSLYVIFYRAINGRFYLAYWLAIMSIYFIFHKNKYWYYLLLLASFFIHQSYVFIVALLLLFQSLKFLRRKKGFDVILILLFILGIIFSEITFGLIQNNLATLPELINDNYTDYLKESYISGQESRDRKWFLVYRTPLLFYTAYLLLIRLKYAKRISFSKSTYALFQFVLLFGVINAFTINIPSFGDRFRNVLIGFILLTLFKVYNENKDIVYKGHLTLLILAFLNPYQ
jgi:hypothetical protein